MRARQPRVGLVGLVRILLLFESALYSVVTPILPHYAHTLGLGKPAVGVLAAAYTAGLIPGSLLGGWLAKRVGVRRTTLLGLTMFAVAVAAFGFGGDILTLDALRFVQGVACGGIWGGALTWVIAVTSQERRGAVLGSVIGAATFGTLLGPALGTLAVAAGTQVVFVLVGVVSLGLALWVRSYSEPEPRPPEPREPLEPRTRGGARHRAPLTGVLVFGTWLIGLEAMTIGAANALLPLRLARLGATGVAIGATFLAASALGTVLSPLIGRVTDRRGAQVPIFAGLISSAILLPLLAWPHTAVLLAVVCVIALGGPLTGYIIPATTVMTESAERAGIALILVTTLFNLAYALGETIGAPTAAVLSSATTDAVPLVVLGVLTLLTLIPAWRLRARRSAGPPSPPSPAQAPSSSPPTDRGESAERPLVATR